MAKKTEDIDPSIGSRIRTRRKIMGMSQADLAAELGISFQQIQKYETGINAIAERRLAQICQIMQLPPDFFKHKGDTAGQAAEPCTPDSTPQPLPEATLAFLATGEGSRLVAAFSSIADVKLRTRILDFICSVASDQNDGE